jgi:uncharacterized protein
MDDDGFTTAICGERVVLRAERALFWPRAATLFVADVHLGKTAAFRAGGVPLPRGSTQSDLKRLTRLIDGLAAHTLVVLGDFLHAKAGRVPALDAAFKTWRATHADLRITLVRGNHDGRAGDPPRDWDVSVVTEPYALPPFLACHMPVTPPTGFALCGHLHPGIVLTGVADASRLPCFVLGPRRAILPAFGSFTGLAIVKPAPDERIVVVAGRKVFNVPH